MLWICMEKSGDQCEKWSADMKKLHTIRTIGLLLILIAAVFLLTISRGTYLKADEEQNRSDTENWIRLGWLVEELPPLQKQSERPGAFDALYGMLFPSLSYSFCFQGDFVSDQEKVDQNEGLKRENEMAKVLETICKPACEVLLDLEQKKACVEKQEEQEVFFEQADMYKEEELFFHKKVLQYTKESFLDRQELLQTFYVVDPSTSAPDNMNIEQLLKKDMTVKADIAGPQILIYHTHSQEGFVDSVIGDPSTTIVGAGERLAECLRNYGFDVIHETGEYDITSRSTAYSNIQPVLEQYLADYPSIQVMIDLHRDEVKEGKLVTEIDGLPTARFMFFNGMSYLNSVGDIGYLYNPNKEDNMAFAFQLQYLSNQYFPGLSRKIYLKGYRYNMHYLPKSLLIELGAQTNTVEEIFNACAPLAEVIARVLSGEK